jgi:glutamate formiminotransferase/glutamate formiminotransferase/formiminotetrahydrofolate cyclodeaminase
VSDLLISVPNVSEGLDQATLDAIGEAFAAGGAQVLDVHVDPDHGRSVFTLAGRPGELAGALAAGVREAVERIDLRAHAGRHPHVGAADVVPVVHLDPARRGAACAEALVAAHLIGEEAAVPCFLYGLLAGGRTRADLRRGGVAALARRVLDGELAPDFGPDRIQAGRGATLVAARPPLVAFNLELAPPATEDDARRIASRIREGGPDGLPGLRAIGLTLPARGGVAQVSMNVEDHLAVPLARVIEAVTAHAEVAEAEVVGLPPAAAFAGYPDALPTRGQRTLEAALSTATP